MKPQSREGTELSHLSIDLMRSFLPQTEILQPLLARALVLAVPDETKAWSASEEVGTVGTRVVDPKELSKSLPALAAEVTDHVRRVFEGVSDAIERASREDWDGTVEALLATAELESGAGRLQAAVALLDSALGLRNRVRDRRTLLPVALTGARLNRQLGRYERAEQLYRKAATLAQGLGILRSAARAWTGLGNLSLDRARWDEALAHYARAESLAQAHSGSLPEEWHIPLNRSIIARRRGDLDRAATELRLAWTRSKGHGDAERDAILWNAEAQLQEERGNPVVAEEAYRLGLGAASDTGVRCIIALNLADLLARTGRSLEAGELARGAELDVLRSGTLSRLPVVYRVLATVTAAHGRFEALGLFEQALQVIDTWRLPEVERARTLEVYGEWEAKHEDPEVGIARLLMAEEIYTKLECAFDATRVRERVERLRERDEEATPGNSTEE